jgi:hypothetical protein
MMFAESHIRGITALFRKFFLLILLITAFSMTEMLTLSGTHTCLCSQFCQSGSNDNNPGEFTDFDLSEDDFFAVTTLADPVQKYVTDQAPALAFLPVFSFPDACWQPPENL